MLDTRHCKRRARPIPPPTMKPQELLQPDTHEELLTACPGQRPFLCVCHRQGRSQPVSSVLKEKASGCNLPRPYGSPTLPATGPFQCARHRISERLSTALVQSLYCFDVAFAPRLRWFMVFSLQLNQMMPLC